MVTMRSPFSVSNLVGSTTLFALKIDVKKRIFEEKYSWGVDFVKGKVSIRIRPSRKFRIRIRTVKKLDPDRPKQNIPYSDPTEIWSDKYQPLLSIEESIDMQINTLS